MDKVALGLFEDHTAANEAVEGLAKSGFSRDHMHVLHPESQAGAAPPKVEAQEQHGSAFHRFLAKIGLIREPQSALVEGSESGMTEPDSRLFAEGVNRGGTIVAVEVPNDATLAQAENILEHNRAIDIDERAADWRKSGWVETPVTGTSRQTAQVSAEAAAPSSPVRVFNRVTARAEESQTGGDALEADYREHFQRVYGSSGNDFDVYLPAYRFGAELSRSTGGSDWKAAEREARREWDQQTPDSWDNFCVAIQYGFERARSGRATVTRPAEAGGAPTAAGGEREPVTPPKS